MRITKGLFIGTIFGFSLSFCIAFIFMIFGQLVGGGVTSLTGETWMYFAVIIPFIITFTVLGGYFHNKNQLSNKKLWLISLLSAFFISLYSGTIGAFTGEYIVRVLIRGGDYSILKDTEYVNGTFYWGTVYASVLLPITTPMARLIIQVFFELLKKFKIAK